MLHEFLTSNRQQLIARCHEKAARRFDPSAIPPGAEHGVPLFLQQLVDTLRLEQSSNVRDDSEPAPTPTQSAIGRAAALHGADMLRLGFSVDQVVHDYGDVCQCVTEMAVEQNMLIATDEFRTLNRCLDNAIADAVTSFGSTRQVVLNEQGESLRERLDYFSGEQRRLIDIAIHAFSAVKTGNIGLTGATGTLLIHALDELRALGERTLPGIRLASTKTTVAAS